MLNLATWNVNSLTVRLDQVLAWLNSAAVDVLALQETKIIDEKFPVQAFVECGYSVVFSGQKTYNGVAIISRYPMHEVLIDVPGLIDPQRRVLVATIGNLRLINLYIPNGSEVGSDKYQYKLAWLTRVSEFIKQQVACYPYVAVVGDFNIAPADLDVHDPAVWEGGVLVSDAERQAFFGLIGLGLTDAVRYLSQDQQLFSWWDYRAARFRRNHGLRIDHILLSASLCQQCTAVGIDKDLRASERPSDHAPVWAKLDVDLQ
jgi:exodeoxyribonuclease III